MKKLIYSLAIPIISAISIFTTFGTTTFAGFITNKVIPSNYRNLGEPQDILILPDNNLWYVDSQNGRIVRMHTSGEIVRTIGRYGSNDGEFEQELKSITMDTNGYLYVLDSCNLYKLDSNGGFLNRWFGCGDIANYTLSDAFSVHFDQSSESLLISDRGHSRVVRYTLNGNYIQEFGTFGTGQGQFDAPSGLTTDADGNIYVVDDGNHRVQKFTSSGTFLSSFGSEGSGDGEFTFPKDVTVLSNGNIVVTSQNSSEVQIFNSSFSYIRTIGSYGSGDNNFIHPKYVSDDSSNNIYISDWAQRSIQKFNSSTGEFLSSIRNGGKTDGIFAYPSSVAYDSAGNLYVIDDGSSSNGRIQKFSNAGTYLETITLTEQIGIASYHIAINDTDELYVSSVDRVDAFELDGTHIRTIGSSGDGNGEFNEARGIDFDSAGNIYVADMFNHRVQKFSALGVYITQWGSLGTGNGQFDHPEAIHIDEDDNVYVGNNGGDERRIQVFDTDGTYIKSISEVGYDPGQVVTPISITTDSDGNLYVSDRDTNTVSIFNSSGVFVERIGSSGSGEDNFTGVNGIAMNTVTKTLTVADTGNHRIHMMNVGVRIRNLISSADVLRTDDSNSLVYNYYNPLSENLESVDSELYFGDYIVSDFTVNLTDERNWQAVNVQAIPETSTALVVNLNPSDAPGVSASHSLYITRYPGQTGVYVCPNAQSLSEINAECSDGYNLNQGDSGLSTVTIEGKDYWKIDNLTGTGAFSVIPEELVNHELSISSSKTGVKVGELFNITVLANTEYRGTITFSSNSSNAILPSNYTFDGTENGTKLFTDLKFNEVGVFKVTVTDTIDEDLTAQTNNITVSQVVVISNDQDNNKNKPIPIISPPIKDEELSCALSPEQEKCQIEVLINNVKLNKRSETQVEICWETNIDTSGVIEYRQIGSTDEYLKVDTGDNTKDTSHCLIISNLIPKTDYSYKITSTSHADKSGNYEDTYVASIQEEQGKEELEKDGEVKADNDDDANGAILTGIAVVTAGGLVVATIIYPQWINALWLLLLGKKTRKEELEN